MIFVYGGLMFLCGLAAGLFRQKALEACVRDRQNECGKADEEIVCSNATVVVDKRGEISWYDNKKMPIALRKDDER